MDNIEHFLCNFDKLNLDKENKKYIYIPDAIPAKLRENIAHIFFNSFSRVGNSRFSIRVVDGRDIHPANFLEARVGDGLIDHINVKDRVLHRYLKKGATIVFDHVNDHIPVAQLIQEKIETITGGRCWIQCYLTQASQSAFHMHQDDHAFVILQLWGKKVWKHKSDTPDVPETVTYTPGSLSYYPKGMSHDVSGLGEISMHLTIAFEPPEEYFIKERYEGVIINDLRRRGVGLPYSINPELISSHTPARAAIRNIPQKGENGKVTLNTGYSLLSVPENYLPILHILARRYKSTPLEMSHEFNISLDDIMKFWKFGFEQGLLFNPIPL